MRILISGGSGMVGKNFLNHKLSSNYTLYAPSSKELNLLQYDAVEAYLKEIQPDLIIHAAGLVGGIQANIKNPVGFLVENLDMGKNLILAAKAAGVKSLINLASSCMYPREAENPLKEGLILQGELEPTNEGYALAKIVCTRLCEYISRTTPEYCYKTIIPCNLYGKYDKFDPKNSHMIPAVIRKIHEAVEAKENEVEIWGDGTARREFMYADELIAFIHYAINNLQRMPQNINVGLGYDYSINEYYETIAKVLGYNGRFVHDLSKPVGMKQKVVDIAQLKDFGWQTNKTLEEGIKETFEYYKTL